MRYVMDNLFLLKLNRSVWVVLLAQKKPLEAISYFESYHSSLLSLQSDKKLKDEVVKELMFSQGLFQGRLTKLALEYMNESDYENALICYTSLFKYNQTDVTAIRNYITCLDALEQYDLETELVKYLESMTSEDKEIYKLLSEICNKNNNISKSIQYYEKYLELKGSGNTTPSEYNQLGCYYNLLYSNESCKYEDIKKSLENFEKAAEMEPFNRLFHKNATIMASKANEWKICAKHWDKLLEINQLTNDDKYDYAAFCLKTGNFEDWYKYFDSRFNKENNKTRYPEISKPKWNGIKDISNSTLLVHYEQGFGDTFLMWGYMPRLAKLAKHIIFVVQDAVYDLLKDNEWGIEVIPKSLANLHQIKFDYHIPSMSVPIVLKLDAENISVGEGYIKPNQELVQVYKKKYFTNKKFKIGISFSGSASGNITRDISIETLLPLDKLKNVELYCLTKGIDDSKFNKFKENKIVNIAADFNNFADTAAAIANLDVVLTTDNCILNLAGAVGKKTLALFNWHHEFRWFNLTGNDVVWLTSVKPFVNESINGWDESVKKAVAEIKNMQNC